MLLRPRCSLPRFISLEIVERFLSSLLAISAWDSPSSRYASILPRSSGVRCLGIPPYKLHMKVKRTPRLTDLALVLVCVLPFLTRVIFPVITV